MLAPVLDFEKRSATEQYIETLPPEIQEAIKEKRAIEGMDREQVLLALGRPRNKVRETKDGVETEDWIYGTAARQDHVRHLRRQQGDQGEGNLRRAGRVPWPSRCRRGRAAAYSDVSSPKYPTAPPAFAYDGLEPPI